jgi:hypothetical protein
MTSESSRPPWGAPYAVLVAEELNASGCGLIVSITPAGRILPMGDPPYLVLIERACGTKEPVSTTFPPVSGRICNPSFVTSRWDIRGTRGAGQRGQIVDEQCAVP